MSRRVHRSIAQSVLMLAVGAVVLTGCSTGAVVTEPPATESPAATTPPPLATASPRTLAVDVEPVSLRNPGAEAEDAFASCSIGKADEGMPVTFDMVSGMGRLDSAKDLSRFVPLTGREPVFSVSGAVWVIQVKGDVLQMGGEVWTDPTCIVAPGVSGYYATGPIRIVNTGKIVQPEAPPQAPDLALPTLGP